MNEFEKYSTYNEILSQSKAWKQAIHRVQQLDLPDISGIDQVIFSGCGSTYYLSISAAVLFQKLTGINTRALPSSELLFNTDLYLSNKNTLLISVSRSGTTTETFRMVEKCNTKEKCFTISISNYPEGISELADLNIVIPEGQELSVAQTGSFSSMYCSALALSARLSKKPGLLEQIVQLPDFCDQILNSYKEDANDLGGNLDYDRFYFLGSGIRYGLACEANLKIKEMTLTHCEPFFFLEFRHGPMSMVTDHTTVIGMVSESSEKPENQVLVEMKELGANIVSLGERNKDISFNSSLSEDIYSILNLPFLQLMAFYRSVAKGLNPDKPNNLEAVIKLEHL